MISSDVLEIYINSRTASQTYNNLISDAMYNLPVIEINKNEKAYICVKNAVIPNSFYNVNNSNTRTLGFTVATTAGTTANGGATTPSNGTSDMSPLVIDKLMNFPNPFTQGTTFSFEHNFPGQNIAVNLSIYTQNGKLVKQINKTANTNGTRNVQITWDGTDAAGSKIARNVYIYKIQISAVGTNYQTSGKLICL